jgi:polysaccharide export outer membrane protein
MRSKVSGLVAVLAAVFLLAGCEGLLGDTAGTTGTTGTTEATTATTATAPVTSSSPAAEAPPAAPATLNEAEYRLGAGDQIRIIVFGNTDLSGEFEVGAEGDIAYPLIGQVQAGGKTLQEVEAEITARLQPDYLKDPSVNVEVLNYRPFFILGEVRNPGSYPYQSGMRVVTAIALAGGYTYRANEGEVLITRASDPSKQKLSADQNATVLPGDIIEVPERFF